MIRLKLKLTCVFGMWHKKKKKTIIVIVKKAYKEKVFNSIPFAKFLIKTNFTFFWSEWNN